MYLRCAAGSVAVSGTETVILVEIVFVAAGAERLCCFVIRIGGCVGCANNTYHKGNYGC